MKIFKDNILIKGFLLTILVLMLTGCVHYSVLTTGQSTIPANVRQLYIDGPFQTQIFVINGNEPRINISLDSQGKSTAVIIKQYGDTLTIQPAHSASTKDISHIILSIYIKNPINISLNHANWPLIYSKPGANFNLTVQNSQNVRLGGGGIIPQLTIRNTVNFTAANGPLYLSEVNFEGPGQASLNEIVGGYVTVNAIGPGSLTLNGNFTLESINQQNGSSVSLNGKINGGNILIRTNGRQQVMMQGINFAGLQFKGYNNDNFDLSGYVGQLNVALYDNAVLSGRWLTVDKAYVKTYDNAFANFYVNKLIFAQAEDQSRISYSGTPAYRYALAKEAAAILPVTVPATNAINKGGWSLN
ncbi:MAG: hypothetical protein A3E87_09675 [Gammaproteobacteria bacterium RIFCSPHIGHO2_12_FULL_35_23]|nr:MAG: hypothetical protein A3E87_09675 [Gammaproteobacteria bacterium RIFCSPHIGHO2_12_FULL_35_23]